MGHIREIIWRYGFSVFFNIMGKRCDMYVCTYLETHLFVQILSIFTVGTIELKLQYILLCFQF